MMGHLIRAQLWRVRRELFHSVLFGALSAAGSDNFSIRFTGGMALFAAAGSVTTLGLFWSRELRVLPLIAETALRTAWCTVMLFPAAIMVGRLLVVTGGRGFDGPLTMTFEAVMLHALFDLIYVGTTVTHQQLPDEPWEGMRQSLDLRTVIRLVALMVWMAVPFATPELLPRSFAEVTWLHILVGIAGLVATAWPVLVTRNQWPSLGILHEHRNTVATERLPPKRTAGWLDRLQGISRLLPGQILSGVILSLLTMGLFAALAVAFEKELQGPFYPGASDFEFLMLGGPILLLLLAPIVAGTGLGPFLRRLKTMPITAHRLVLTMTALPLVAYSGPS